MIPLSVLVMTRNEAARIESCLAALRDFAEVIVVDSNSDDNTRALAEAAGARVESFTWNGAYPKKRQWCLDNLALAHDRVFFVDADEIVTPELTAEIRKLFTDGPQAAGYFVKGRYVIDGRPLRFGLHNNKLCLFDRRKMMFPVIDDVDLPGMGEIEGHYQPVFKKGCENEKTGQLKNALLHYAYDGDWQKRHERYAAWERGMNSRNAWPRDPVAGRQVLKELFRALPGRGFIAFCHCYFLRLGFLDGRAGFGLARDRWRYYRMIAKS